MMFYIQRLNGLIFVFSLGIFIGFATFFFMEKTLRVLGGDEDGHGHSHSHPQSHVPPEVIKNSSINGSATEDNLRSRNTNKTATNESSPSPGTPNTANGPSKLSAYLNLFGDFVHNMSVSKTSLVP